MLRYTCRTMKLLLSPHNDDESLFAAYTLIREKPTVLIITDSDMQLDRGISAAQRKEESRRACETLGVPVRFLGLKDGSVKEDDLRQLLLPFTEQEWDCVYAPAIEGGHPRARPTGQSCVITLPQRSLLLHLQRSGCSA